MPTLTKCKKLAKEECCNYCYEDNSCLKYNRLCMFYCPFDGNDVLLRCLYFEQNVLPINPVLENQYHFERKLPGVRDLATCANLKCKKTFLPSSGHQKYCKECKKKVQRNQKRDWIRNNRKST
jgi:hypothetical protein